MDLTLFMMTKKGRKEEIIPFFKSPWTGLNLLHLGDLGHKIKTRDDRNLKTPDILFVPIGGTYTIDANIASEVIANLEPKIAIPMHYQVSGENRELPRKLIKLMTFFPGWV